MGIVRRCYKVICVLCLLLAAVFWVYRYLQDEDLIRINYKKFENLMGEELPIVSICFWHPVLEDELKSYDINFTTKGYYRFLSGNKNFKGMEKVDFSKVTTNLNNFLKRQVLILQTKEFLSGNQPNFVDGPLEVTYSGFRFAQIIKCYGLRIKNKDTRMAIFNFDLNMFPHGIRPGFQSDMCISTVVHQPDEFLLEPNTYRNCLEKRKSNRSYSFRIFINNADFFKRRNKRSRACMDDELKYDATVFKEHVENFGCKPPYLNIHGNYSVCSTQHELKKTNFDFKFHQLLQTSNVTLPCTSLQTTNIWYEQKDDELIERKKGLMKMEIYYPAIYKEIQEVRSVDLQTVVGNAGGYIGLFCGKI